MSVAEFEAAKGAPCPRCGRETFRLVDYGNWKHSRICPSCANGDTICCAFVVQENGAGSFCSEPALYCPVRHELVCAKHRHQGDSHVLAIREQPRWRGTLDRITATSTEILSILAWLHIRLRATRSTSGSPWWTLVTKGSETTLKQSVSEVSVEEF